MKKLFVASIALLALNAGGSALAADLPVKARPLPPPPPVYNWTGFYVGATAGGAWSKADVTLNTVNNTPRLYRPLDIPGLDAIGSPSISGSNAIVGGKIGYNQQWGSFVLGLEGGISWFHFNKSAFTTGNPFLASDPLFIEGFANFNTNVSTTWLATVRGRIGYAVDRVLFYGTGGAAFANVKFSNTYVGFSPGGFRNENEASSASKTKTGWAAGGGIDYALTPNCIVSVEYLHVDLGTISASGLVTTENPNIATMNFSTKLTSDLVRGGISYKFY
jgi:outer membrane immunogenic protein